MLVHVEIDLLADAVEDVAVSFFQWSGAHLLPKTRAISSWFSFSLVAPLLDSAKVTSI
jgi:hypothetical protein